jgi:hypothetical protein
MGTHFKIGRGKSRIPDLVFKGRRFSLAVGRDCLCQKHRINFTVFKGRRFSRAVGRDCLCQKHRINFTLASPGASVLCLYEHLLAIDAVFTGWLATATQLLRIQS